MSGSGGAISAPPAPRQYPFLGPLLAVALLSLLAAVACLSSTAPLPVKAEPCFLADTIGRSAEFNRDMPCWLWISDDCTLQQVCVHRPSPNSSGVLP